MPYTLDDPTVRFAIAYAVIVGTFFLTWVYLPNIRRKFEPKSGFKIKDAFIDETDGVYCLRIRDYLYGESYLLESNPDTRPTTETITDAVKWKREKLESKRTERKKFQLKNDTFRAEFKGRVFQD